MEKKILKRLFIVDDDADILVLTKHCLKKQPDIEVKYINSAELAIQEALLSPPDMMLVDVMMPRMDGVAAFKVIKSLPTLTHIPIVFFTAKVQQGELSEYHKLGVVDVITKPFDPRTFVQRICEIWDKLQAN